MTDILTKLKEDFELERTESMRFQRQLADTVLALANKISMLETELRQNDVSTRQAVDMLSQCSIAHSNLIQDMMTERSKGATQLFPSSGSLTNTNLQ